MLRESGAGARFAGGRIESRYPRLSKFDRKLLRTSYGDIAIAKGTLQDFQSKHPTTAELIVEIADSSLFEDTTTKAEVYATGGIADYWVIDVENRLLLIFRDPAPLPEGGLAYRTCLKLKESDSASPLALPTAGIRVGDLLG